MARRFGLCVKTKRFLGLWRARLQNRAVAPVVLSLGWLLTICCWIGLHHGEHHAAEQKAADLTLQEADKIKIQVLRSLEVLHSVAALHEALGGVTRAQFHQFVQGALERQPELLALSWNPCVTDARRAEFEGAARRDGLGDFAFRESRGGGELAVSGRHAAYVPVYYIEPMTGNAAALGYDLNTDPARYRSLEAARDAGQPVATSPVRLTQAAQHETGLLVVQPVYTGGNPATVLERRKRLEGYAVAVFRVADLVGASFKSLVAAGIDARLSDEAGVPETIYQGSLPLATEDGENRPAQIRFEIAGHQWVISYVANSRFYSAQSHGQSSLLLAGGLSLTLLLALHLHLGARRTRAIALANAALQDEIQVRQQAEQEAARANQAKTDFLASMSHEIRTPLNAILGYVQLMRHDPNLSPEQRDSISGINSSGQHLLGLINEILDLSKIEAGRMELNPVDFDLASLGRNLRATFQPLCAQKRIGFRFVTDAEGPTPVVGDEGKLRQVLINLVGNAVKFTAAGEVFLRFHQEASGLWLFEVIDTGLGIPEEERENIFKPFHQGGNAAHQGGTGLGLTIASRQIELLGGRLELQSERGAGSRFYFRIPLATSSRVEVETSAFGFPRLKAGQTVRTLIVDDRRENREILREMLRRAGCEVLLAHGGLEALRLARQHTPQIIFLDLLMPGLDGMETLRELARDPSLAKSKVIAHTAAALSNYEREARLAGCVDFLPKPIRAEQVWRCLRDHLGVELECAEPNTAPLENPIHWDSGQIELPVELLTRLTTAAELHSSTALKHCLQDLRLIGPEARVLAEHIRHLLRSYDMHGILRLISEVSAPVATPASNGFAAD